MDNRTTCFLNFLLTKKDLTRKQRREISHLLARDITRETVTEEEIISSSDKREIPPAYHHDVKPVFDFLHLFTEVESLKYTTHQWDRSLETGKYSFESYSDFKKRNEKILDKHNIYSYNKELWKLTKNFLLNEDPTYCWSEHQIKIGYNKYVEQWMNENPDEQPMAMPLSAFPSDLIPGPINRRTLSSFGDVVDVFKRCIEFRDNDLYILVRKIFKRDGFTLNKDKLKSLEGKVFYTYTEAIKQVLEQIADNIFHRPDSPDIEISCQRKEGKIRDKYILEILQVGSFSNKIITDRKVLGLEENGTINIIKNKLKNLCDFYVEGIFEDKDNEKKAFRINYLTSSSSPQPLYEEIQKSECNGYKTILTFYVYKNNEKSNNN